MAEISIISAWLPTSRADATAILSTENKGPLTTNFQQFKNCRELTIISSAAGMLPEQTSDPNKYPEIWQILPFSIPNDSRTCYPSGALVTTVIPYFSPGLCPNSWTVHEGIATGKEHTAWCCPSGFTTIHFSYWNSNFRCFNWAWEGTPTIWAPETPTIHGRVTTFSQRLVYAPAIQIRWQDGDRDPYMEPKNAIFSLSFNGTGDSQSFSNGSLSSGAKIALAVGIPFGILLISVFGFINYRRVHHERQHGGAVVGAEYINGDMKEPEMDLCKAVNSQTSEIKDSSSKTTSGTKNTLSKVKHEEIFEIGDSRPVYQLDTERVGGEVELDNSVALK